jgi:hypothetical protein
MTDKPNRNILTAELASVADELQVSPNPEATRRIFVSS